jgi:hypothetical protein
MLARFAAGLRRDFAAITAALELPRTTSPVERQISRLKLAPCTAALASNSFALGYCTQPNTKPARKVLENPEFMDKAICIFSPTQPCEAEED